MRRKTSLSPEAQFVWKSIGKLIAAGFIILTLLFLVWLIKILIVGIFT